MITLKQPKCKCGSLMWLGSSGWVCPDCDAKIRPRGEGIVALGVPRIEHDNESGAHRVCEACCGLGQVDCLHCDGDGEIYCEHCGSYSDCSECDGEGKIECDECDGTGVVSE